VLRSLLSFPSETIQTITSLQRSDPSKSFFHFSGRMHVDTAVRTTESIILNLLLTPETPLPDFSD